MTTPDDYLVSLDAEPEGALAQADRRFEPAVLHDHGADGHRQPGARVARQRPRRARIPRGRSIPKPASGKWKWYSTPQEEGRSRRSRPGRTSTPPGTAAATCGFPASTIPRPSSISSAPAIPLRPIRPDSGRGRQPVHLLPCRNQRDTGKLEWHLPDVATRHSRLGLRRDPRAGRRRVQRQATQAGHAGHAATATTSSLDRVTGERLSTGKFSDGSELGEGRSTQRAARCAIRQRTSISPARSCPPRTAGVTNWPPPASSPDTGLFYVPQNESYSMYYLTETDPLGAMGLGGKEEQNVDSLGTFLTAIDYKTGKVAWQHTLRRIGIVGRHLYRPRLPDDGRKPAVRRRPGRQHRGLRSRERKSPLARAAWGSVQRAADLHARRPPIHSGGGCRHVVRVRTLAVAHGRATTLRS